ncbi:MAG: DUF1707 domain-containing protein [Solirubrobacteraceae bacterium]|nr:DUF1707 domain-containing protein [Solirubrobacteraceae bacterium]
MTADDHPDVRASDSERERTIDVLRVAAGEGRLTFEELADRIEAAAAARTRAELALLTRDLPTTEPEPASASAAATGASAELVVPEERSAVFGDVRRSGAWVVPAKSRWSSWFGDIVLDLREATVSFEEVTIDAGSVFGSIDLLVPEGVVVDIRSKTLFGSIHEETGAPAPAGAPRVILIGGSTFGDVRVRNRRLRERVVGSLLGRGTWA